MLQPVSHLESAHAGAKPGFVPPLIPTLVDEPPAGDGWLHEIKHDGYRTILVVEGGRVCAFTRNGHEWTERYARVCHAAERLRCRSAVIDGEIIVQGENGVSDFDALRADVERGGRRLILYAFDLLRADGKDVRSAPLVERRTLLRNLIRPAIRSPLQFSDHFEGRGCELLAAADAMGLRASCRSGRAAATAADACQAAASVDLRPATISVRCRAVHTCSRNHVAVSPGGRHYRRTRVDPNVSAHAHQAPPAAALDCAS